MAPNETEDNSYAKFWGDEQRALRYFLEWSIKLPGAYLFQTHLRGSLIESGDLFNIAKTMVLVVHKELKYKVETPKYKKLEVMQPTIKTESELPVGE